MPERPMREQPAVTVHVDSDNPLAELVTKALVAWPKLMYAGKRDSRAHKAAELVARGRVRPITGSRYDVDGKRCDVELDWCECADHENGAPLYPKVGRLCKHRLAARMHRATGGDRNESLINLVAAFVGQPWARLVMDWDYRSDRRAIVGFEAPGGRKVRWPANKAIVFTWPQLRQAVGAIDWGLTKLPEKAAGYDYLLHLAPGKGIEITDANMHTHGTTETMQHRAAQRQGWEREVAVNGNLVGVPIDPAAAQRIYAERMDLRDRGVATV